MKHIRVENPGEWIRLIAGYTLVFCSLLFYLFPEYPQVLYSVQKVADLHPKAKQILQQSRLLPDTGLTPAEIERADWLSIPTIEVKAEIQRGSSLAVLDHKEGVWLQTGDVNSNLVLAGHRFQYLPPNTQTFYNLNKLKVGDEIFIYIGGKQYHYQVNKTFEVNVDQVDILNPTSIAQLTLYTCKDLTYSKRIVVTALLEDS